MYLAEAHREIYDPRLMKGMPWKAKQRTERHESRLQEWWREHSPVPHSQTVNDVTTRYTLDLESGLTQVLSDGENTYLYGLRRIAQSSINNPQTTMIYFLTDALGSVRQLADANGVVVLMKRYTPYGEVESEVSNPQSTIHTSYGYTNEWTDPTGLVYLRARYYSPGIGRFMMTDTWGGSTLVPNSYNSWLYGNANPVNHVDPSGMDDGEYGGLNPPNYPEKGSTGWERNPPSGITFYPGVDPLGQFGALGIPRNHNKAQFLNLQRHHIADGQVCYYCNLCGQVSIAAILANRAGLNVTVQDVMAVYEANDGDNLNTTGPANLTDILNKGYNRYVTADDSDSNDCLVWYTLAGIGASDTWRYLNQGYSDPKQRYPEMIRDMMRAWFENQQWPIVGVRINSDGMVAPYYFGVGSHIGHWVVLTGVSKEFDNDAGNWMNYTEHDPKEPKNYWRWRWVRIYNPFDNQTEYYPFQYFLDSWIDDGNMSTLVTIRNDYWFPSLKCWEITNSP
jgi:RHS repeat-associated protein